MPTSRSFILLGLLTACASHPGDVDAEPRSARSTTEDDVATPMTARPTTQPRATPRPVALRVALHPSEVEMTEVVLAPRGDAALTLDEDGGVRLWPRLDAEAPQIPWELPVRDSAWMSVGVADAGFVGAFVDTAGALRVARIADSAVGPTWTPTFEHPATDGTFEAHVVDGGRRVLALSVDHRLHLWTADGEHLDTLEAPGFVPWQLRVGHEGPGGPHVVAVLGRPTRAQRIVMAGDRLRRVGEPLPLDLDRGPNRNDVVMSPDGTTLAVLRRPLRRSKRFDVELIELETGARTLVSAESDLRQRPRMHALSDARMLLESGSGAGFILPLSAGSAWTRPADDVITDEGETPTAASDPPLTELTSLALPSSTLATRMHIDVRGDVRAIPTARGLTIDPIGDAPAHTFGQAPLLATAMALDTHGERVLWATEQALWLESWTTPEAPTQLPTTRGPAELVAFVSEQRVVTVDERGRATLRALDSQEVLDTAKLPTPWGTLASAWRPSNTAHEPGHIALASLESRGAATVLAVDGARFGAPISVPLDRRHEWPEAGKPRRHSRQEWTEALGLPSELGLRPQAIQLTEPDPTGTRLAIVQELPNEDRFEFDPELEEWIPGPRAAVITIYDRTESRRLWTRPTFGLTDLAWSADGERFGFVDVRAGYVCDAATGEIAYSRHDLGLTVRAEGLKRSSATGSETG